MGFTYYGKCYFCGQDTYITSTPIGGMRLCEECLKGIGELFLDFIEMAKEGGRWGELTTKEIIPKMLGVISKTGEGEYLFIKENSYFV